MSSEQPTVGQLESGGTPTQQQHPERGSLACALRAPRAISLAVAGPPLLRPGAVALRLCRYSGANARRPLQLSRSRLIRNIVLIGRLTRELNSLPQPHGAFHCPMDDGSEIVLHAGYRHLRPRGVIVGLTGCHFITNGWTDRTGPSPQAAHLVRKLTALAGR